MKTFIFHDRQSSETEDHILEFLYDKVEKDKTGTTESVLKLFKDKESSQNLEVILQDMIKNDYITRSNGHIHLTENGLNRAEMLVRGHRLAQRLMVDVLGIAPENSDKVAHYMEHILDSDILDSISAFLGYPETSPDGKLIPHQNRKKIFTIKPALYKLSHFPVGKHGKICYIQNPQSSLSHLGILPGERIRLVQKKPSVILELGHTTVALDSSFAGDIYVQPESEEKTVL